jgi:hypothetical protein
MITEIKMDRITVLTFQDNGYENIWGTVPPKFCDARWVAWREVYSITAMEATDRVWPVKIACGDHLRTATGFGSDGRHMPV